MARDESRELYVGYLPQAPPRIGLFVRRVAVGLVLLAAVSAFALVFLHQPFEPGIFEFGVVESFEGRVRERPYPRLLASGTADAGAEVGASGEESVAEELAAGHGVEGSVLLVVFGKHGAAPSVAGLDGHHARLRGSLIAREGSEMIEIAGTVEDTGIVEDAGFVADRGSMRDAREDLGITTLRGEIVDSKCFLGVMKPGRGKPHRSCAARCISGGVPPMLRVETRAGERFDLLLADARGEPVGNRILDFVAEPIEIEGRVWRDAGQLFLYADPSAIRRLGREVE